MQTIYKLNHHRRNRFYSLTIVQAEFDDGPANSQSLVRKHTTGQHLPECRETKQKRKLFSRPVGRNSYQDNLIISGNTDGTVVNRQVRPRLHLTVNNDNQSASTATISSGFSAKSSTIGKQFGQKIRMNSRVSTGVESGSDELKRK